MGSFLGWASGPQFGGHERWRWVELVCGRRACLCLCDADGTATVRERGRGGGVREEHLLVGVLKGFLGKFGRELDRQKMSARRVKITSRRERKVESLRLGECESRALEAPSS